MNDTNRKQLGQTLWGIADQLRGAMNADDFRDYMPSFLFLRYLSDNYEIAARKELGRDYPVLSTDLLLKTGASTPLQVWYEENKEDIPAFEKQMRRKVHYVIEPAHLWNSIANLARTQNAELLNTLQAGFKYIETESFESTFQGLFSEINLGSDKLGRTYADRNAKLCTIIQKIAEGLNEFSTDIDALGDAYEYLIGQFAAGSGKKAGEFYTPQQISDILSTIVTLDSQEPRTGPRNRLESVLDFACGSGSLLLNVRKRMGPQGIGRIYGQEKNITTYNLARMNMLLHGVKDTEFEIYHGDTLTNEWDTLRELNPARKPSFDAVVANPPFSYRWEPTDATGDDVLFINAAEHFVKGKRQNQLTDGHIARIIDTYQFRKEEPRYSRRVEMAEIEKNDFNLNISRYISTAVGEEEISLEATHAELLENETVIQTATQKHNAFLKELGLPALP